MKSFHKKRSPAMAILILFMSLLVISLALQDLIQTSNLQVSRVRNSMDRIHAIYIARSTLNLSRAFIFMDAAIDRNLTGGAEASDSPADPWATPMVFPIPIELISSFFNSEESEQEPVAEDLSIQQKDQLSTCNEFFEDFPGEAYAETIDLSSRLNLNDMESEAVQQVFLNLLSPTYDFIQELEQREIRPQDVVYEVRDYIDQDDVENVTNALELNAYTNRELPYEPKNRPMNVLDELKLIPSVDNALYAYLSDKVSAAHFSGRKKPGKLNLNTVSKDVFQAILKDVSNPEELAADFVQDRDENSRLYNSKNIADQLEAAGISRDNVDLGILGGQSELFLVKVQSVVNEMEVELEAVIKKPTGKKETRPIVRMRISP